MCILLLLFLSLLGGFLCILNISSGFVQVFFGVSNNADVDIVKEGILGLPSSGLSYFISFSFS